MSRSLVSGRKMSATTKLMAATAHQRPGAGAAQPAPRPPSPDVARYVALFNRRDWDGLRAIQADDLRLVQFTYPLRAGAAKRGHVLRHLFAQRPRAGRPRLARRPPQAV